MNNNFYNSNKDMENEDKYSNRRIAISSAIILVALVFSAVGTYFFTDRLTNPRYTDDTNLEEKTVYNNTKALNDDMTVVLMNEGIVEKEQSILEFKAENEISSDVNEQFIVNFFEANGYNLESLGDDKAVFMKDGTTSVLEPNKYYIGEKDGFFAIYKTDNKGQLTIENEEDVYSNSRSVNFLPAEDLAEIKNFKNSYDTKEEAVEKLTAYIS